MKTYTPYIDKQMRLQVMIRVHPTSPGRHLHYRLDLARHSLRFNFFTDGGRAQLALALCADALGDDRRALRVYQEFKRLALKEAVKRTTDFEVAAICGRIERQMAPLREEMLRAEAS